MLEELHQQLKALQKPAGLENGPGALPFGIAAIDDVLGGGLARGTLHEIAATAEAHLAAATGFTLGLLSSPSPRRRGEGRGEGLFHSPQYSESPPHPTSSLRSKADLSPQAGRGKNLVWVAEDMAHIESGVPYGPGLDTFKLAPERLLSVTVSRPRDLLWAMEEALRCRAIGAVIGEMRHGALDAVAVRRLSLAAADSGALALLLRAKPGSDASTAATRWIVGAVPSSHPHTYQSGAPRFAAHLTRNRRGPTGSWILEWSDTDERFVLPAPALPVAAPAPDRPRRQMPSRHVA
jgi:protein ImuA